MSHDSGEPAAALVYLLVFALFCRLSMVNSLYVNDRTCLISVLQNSDFAGIRVVLGSETRSWTEFNSNFSFRLSGLVSVSEEADEMCVGCWRRRTAVSVVYLCAWWVFVDSLAGLVGAGLEDGRDGVSVADGAEVFFTGRLQQTKKTKAY